MAEYRKKPVVIEAVQLRAAERGSKPYDWEGNPFAEAPEWLAAALSDGTITEDYDAERDSDYLHFKIKTLEGDMTASPLDWIIKGVKGELYPCKPDIFDATYEKV